MSGKAGAVTRTGTPTRLGLLSAILWTATHPTQDGRTERDALALIARLARHAIDKEPLP